MMRPLPHLALMTASAIALVPTLFMLVTALKSQEPMLQMLNSGMLQPYLQTSD